jgi:hypothetical protein
MQQLTTTVDEDAAANNGSGGEHFPVSTTGARPLARSERERRIGDGLASRAHGVGGRDEECSETMMCSEDGLASSALMVF